MLQDFCGTKGGVLFLGINSTQIYRRQAMSSSKKQASLSTPGHHYPGTFTNASYFPNACRGAISAFQRSLKDRTKVKGTSDSSAN